jgi:hypothetical protein
MPFPNQPQFTPFPSDPLMPATPGLTPAPSVPVTPAIPDPTSPPPIPVVTPAPTATPGVDILDDLPGDTDLYCGPNQDVLFFHSGNGIDYVYNFDPSDTGDLLVIDANVNGTALQSVDQLSIFDSDLGAVVDLGLDFNNGILLVGVSTSDLDATDFAILPPIDSNSFV